MSKDQTYSFELNEAYRGFSEGLDLEEAAREIGSTFFPSAKKKLKRILKSPSRFERGYAVILKYDRLEALNL